MLSFLHHDWREFYGHVKEAIPPNAPKSRGKDVDLRIYVDSDHAGDKQTRRSRSDFFIYMRSFGYLRSRVLLRHLYLGQSLLL